MGVSCTNYDQLELAAMHRKTVLLTFQVKGNQAVNIECVVNGLKTREGKEYLITEDNKEYELSELISIEAKK